MLHVDVRHNIFSVVFSFSSFVHAIVLVPAFVVLVVLSQVVLLATLNHRNHIMLERLISHWVYGGFLAGLLLLALCPLLIAGWSEPLVATYLLLPAYMIHQYEEHDDDRFRRFINRTIGQGYEVLSPWAVFVLNIPGVWGIIALSLYGAVWVNLGWALVAVYLVLVNALVHITHAMIFRRYNPGLITSIVIFLPLGAVTLYQVVRAGGGSFSSHAIGLGCSLTIHGAIALHFKRRLALLRSSTKLKN